MANVWAIVFNFIVYDLNAAASCRVSTRGEGRVIDFW